MEEPPRLLAFAFTPLTVSTSAESLINDVSQEGSIEVADDPTITHTCYIECIVSGIQAKDKAKCPAWIG
jgi:hypothetical protein